MADIEAQELLKKKTVPLLRAVLTAKAKEGVALHMLLHEFQEQTFSPLEFKKMGYGTLEQYLRDSPELCRVQRAPEGYLVVKGVASEEDAHIFKLVGGQRKQKKKGKRVGSGLKVKRTASHFAGGKKPNFKTTGFIQHNNNFMQRSPLLQTPPTFGIGYKKFAAPSPMGQKAAGTTRGGELAPRFQKTTTGKNLFTNQTTKKPANLVASNKESKDLQMTIFPGGGGGNDRTKKTTHFSSTSNSYDAPSGGAVAKTQLSPDAIKTMGKRLRELLEGKPNGLWATRLQPEYKAKYHDTLPEDFRDIIREHFLSFVKIDSPMANLEILYYKGASSPVPQGVGEQSRKVEIVKPASTSTVPSSHVNDADRGTSQQTNHSNGISRQNYVHSSMRQPQQNISNDSVPLKVKTENHHTNGTNSPQVNGVLHKPEPQVVSRTTPPQKLPSPRTNSFNIAAPNLPDVGAQIRVFVCHVESLDRFFVQYSDSTIEDLVSDMQMYYDDPSNCQDIDKPRLNDFCSARYSKDQVWCRAKILSVKEQKNSVNVSYCCRLIFVDYGNDEYKVATELKTLTNDFCKLPSQAIQCCLHNLYPVKEGSSWSEKVTSHFRQVTENVELTLIVKERTHTALSVDLIDGNGQSVSAYFCTSQIAKLSAGVDDNGALETKTPSPPSIQKAKPEYVVVPEDQDYIDVAVVLINSANDVVIVLLGPEYNEKAEALEEQMSKHYESDRPAPTFINEDGYYAVPYQGDWVRAKVMSVKGNEYEVFLLDRGNKTTVSREEIKELPAMFFKPPFQAIQCVLANVSESYDADVLQYLTDYTHEKDLIGYIVERPLKPGAKMSIELYDTNEDDDININNEVILKIENEKNLAPKLPDERGVLCTAYIAHIANNGDVYIQIPGAGTAKLEILMNDMSSHFTTTRAFEIVQRPEVGTICCAKFCEDGLWYRAKVTKVMSAERKVEVEFIDYGNREVIQSLFIRNPDAVNKQVISLPPQALKCQIAECADLNLTAETYKKMNEFAQQELDNVYISVVEYKDSTPIISILVPSEREDEEPTDFVVKYQLLQAAIERQENQSTDMSIGQDAEDSVFVETIATANTSFEEISVAGEGGSFCTISPLPSSKSSSTLLAEYEVINSVPIDRMQLRSESPAIMFSSSWGLPQMMLTEQGRIIEGVITDTHHPYKFSFVPFFMWEKLEEMHLQMCEHYQDTRFDENNMTFCKGDICAAHHSKHGIWYRAVVVQAIEDQLVLKYLDFSTTVEVESLQNIRPLHNKFKELPFLAVRCSLYGVEPVDKAATWDIDTASMFNTMIMNVTFQVEVMGSFCESDFNKPLEVCLFGDEDGKPFNLNEKLVSLGHARKKR